MNLELNSRNILLAMMIAFGLCLEALKLLPTSASSSSNVIESVEERLFSAKPYAVSEKAIHKTIVEQSHRRVTRLPVPPMVKFDMKGAIEKFANENQKVVDEQKKKEEAAKDWHWVYNKKLGQWVWKKRTDKDKKATKAETVVAQSAAINPIDIEKLKDEAKVNKDGNATPSFGSASNPPVGGYNNLTSNASNHRFLSQSEWEAKLLRSPNPTETKAFAQAYLNHLVTETVFYNIVDQMLKNSSVDMQQQGVLALSMVPAANSFTRLAKESTTVQTSSPLYQPVQAALKSYESTKNIDEIEDVLKNTKLDTSTLTLALTTLQNSIRTNLPGSTTNPSGQGGANAKLYQSFIPVLTTLANNPALRNQASSILQQLGASSNSAVAQF